MSAVVCWLLPWRLQGWADIQQTQAGKKGVFVVIPRCIHLSKNHWIKSGGPCASLNMIWEGYSYNTIHNFIKKRHRRASARLCSRLHHPKLLTISVTLAFRSQFEQLHLAALRCTISIWLTSGVKLTQTFREKWLLPPDKTGRSFIGWRRSQDSITLLKAWHLRTLDSLYCNVLWINKKGSNFYCRPIHS